MLAVDSPLVTAPPGAGCRQLSCHSATWCRLQAAVDKLRNGGCPTCHRYFLIFYILREKGLIDLVVTTFLPENPPKEVLDISSGKHYPLVKVHKGIDSYGNDMTGIECDTVDEIEALVSRFDCKCMMSSRQSVDEALAEKCLQNLYTASTRRLDARPAPLVVPGQVVDARPAPLVVPGQVVDARPAPLVVPGQVVDACPAPLVVPGQVVNACPAPLVVPGRSQGQGIDTFT